MGYDMMSGLTLGLPTGLQFCHTQLQAFPWNCHTDNKQMQDKSQI